MGKLAGMAIVAGPPGQLQAKPLHISSQHVTKYCMVQGHRHGGCIGTIYAGLRGKRPVARQLVQRAAGNTAATYVTRLA